jgi:hypothetical protein
MVTNDDEEVIADEEQDEFSGNFFVAGDFQTTLMAVKLAF